MPSHQRRVEPFCGIRDSVSAIPSSVFRHCDENKMDAMACNDRLKSRKCSLWIKQGHTLRFTTNQYKSFHSQLCAILRFSHWNTGSIWIISAAATFCCVIRSAETGKYKNQNQSKAHNDDRETASCAQRRSSWFVWPRRSSVKQPTSQRVNNNGMKQNNTTRTCRLRSRYICNAEAITSRYIIFVPH